MLAKVGSGSRAPLARLLAIVLFLAPWVVADTTKDLGSVLAGNSELSTFTNLVKQYPDIILQLPSYAGVTIVAPNNDAFKKLQGFDTNNKTLVTNFLEYHILQGTVNVASIPVGPPTIVATLLTDPALTNVTGGQKLIINKQPENVVIFTSGEGSRSTLVSGDIQFTGGLIQVVDTLLQPPSRLEPTARDAYRDLTAFLGALYAADALSPFADASNVTIFAPRNAAFQLLAGTLSGLSKDQLARVLRYHLVPNQVLGSSALRGNTTLDTAAGPPSAAAIPMHVLRDGNNVYVDSSQIVQPDVLIANGIVHIIANVLNPDSPSATPNPDLASQPPVFPISGNSSVGTKAPTPFTTALPCTADCPVTTTANPTGTGSSSSTAGVRSTSSNGLAAAPRCTGVAGIGLGVGVGVGLIMGMA